MENTASQSLSFTVVPNFSVNTGAIYDNDSYDQSPRGYTSYTGFIGGTWQALPNLTGSVRAGASYTETEQQPANGQSSVSGSFGPYADVSVDWKIGERSALSADYSHETTPSDFAGSSAQESDRFLRLLQLRSYLPNFHQLTGVIHV